MKKRSISSRYVKIEKGVQTRGSKATSPDHTFVVWVTRKREARGRQGQR